MTKTKAAAGEPLARLLKEVRACRICKDNPNGAPLGHEPRPVLQVGAGARIAIFGQAPGNIVYQTGVPFNDPSGDRLRAWMGVDRNTFYDPARIAIVPMGFCFPGYDAKGSDRPPRKECARAWRTRLMDAIGGFDTALLVGAYAQRWHLGAGAQKNLTETVAAWRDYAPAFFPMPHPSWRNNAWLKRNPWFEEALIPALRKQLKKLL